MAKVKPTLNDADINLLRDIFVDKYEFDDRVRAIVKDEVSHLPTRDEFYEEMAKMHKKHLDLEEEKDVLAHQVSRNSDNIALVAKNLKISIVD